MANESALDHLRSLGTSADQVAASLEALGIKGHSTRSSCPIARYLNANSIQQGVGSIQFLRATDREKREF
jgi:hypothetical protein